MMNRSKVRNTLSNMGLATLACWVLGAASLPRTAAAQSAYTITDLGTLGGSSATVDYLNEAGVVVGSSSYASGANDAFYWHNGVMTGLGLTSTTYTPAAWGINNAAQPLIVGTDLEGFLYGYAFSWQNGTLTWLPSLGGSSYATSVNDAGQIVGYAGVGNNLHGALWYNGSITDLGLLPGGKNSFASAINAYGYIVGSADNSSGNYHGVYWDSTGIHDLGTLLTGTSSTCYGVQRGESYSFAVGVADTMVNGNDYQHACAFDGGAPEDIGTLGGDQSAAFAVNDYFQIVGDSQRDDASFGAFIYTWFGDDMYDLNDLIPANSGWELISATAINDHGQIVGSGTINGANHSFLLTPAYHLKSVTVKPATVAGSATANGTVTLDSPAPTDLLVYLGSSGQVAIPTYCIIPEGETSQQFLIDTTAVSTSITVQISAQLYSTAKSAPLTIRPIQVKSLTISPASVKGGKTAVGKITLEYPSSPKPITVTLSSSNSAVASPASTTVVVPEGKTTATFKIVTGSVAGNTPVTFTASANGASKTAKLTVTP